MISVVIPYHSNNHGLAVLLTLLQQQTTLPDSIHVFDNSENKSGKEIVDRYTLNVPIIYHKHNGSIYEAWNKGCLTQKSKGILILNDDVLIPLTLITYLQKALSTSSAYAFVTEVPAIDHREKIIVNQPFKWIQTPSFKLKKTQWIPGFCFMLTQNAINTIGLFDTKFKIWYGDLDYQERLLKIAHDINLETIMKVSNLFVYHYGTSSYDLYSESVQKQISLDEKAFDQKYHHIPNYSQVVIKRALDEIKNE